MRAASTSSSPNTSAVDASVSSPNRILCHARQAARRARIGSFAFTTRSRYVRATLRPDVHYRSLDGLRGLAAYTVVVSHFSNSTGIFGGLFGSGAGQVGVLLFFVLSGFLMGRLYFDRPLSVTRVGDFFRRRFARVVPLYLIVVLASYLWLRWYGIPWPLYGVTGDALLAHLLFVDGTGILWTVPTEIQFYVLFPLFWLFAARFGVSGRDDLILRVSTPQAASLRARCDFDQSQRLPFPPRVSRRHNALRLALLPLRRTSAAASDQRPRLRDHVAVCMSQDRRPGRKSFNSDLSHSGRCSPRVPSNQAQSSWVKASAPAFQADIFSRRAWREPRGIGQARFPGPTRAGRGRSCRSSQKR